MVDGADDLGDDLRPGPGPRHHLQHGLHFPGDAKHRQLEPGSNCAMAWGGGGRRGRGGGGGGEGGQSDGEVEGGGGEEAGGGEGVAGVKDVVSPRPPRPQTEGVAAVVREVEGGQHHHQPGTARLCPDCPGAGGEGRDGGRVVGGGEDSEVV